MSSLPELELSQLAGSSTGEGVGRREEVDDSRSSAAAASLVPAPDTDDLSAPEPSQLAGSSAGERVERQEEEDALLAPAAAAAAPLVPAPDTAELRQLAGSYTGESSLQEEENEMLEANVIFMPVEDNLLTRVFIVPNPMAVRYVYAVLFAVMTIVAWTVRDIELSRFDHAIGCDGSHDCIAANGVLRVSMGVAVSLVSLFKCMICSHSSVVLLQIPGFLSFPTN
jgi:nucleotide-binding universal stress UspA family protein